MLRRRRADGERQGERRRERQRGKGVKRKEEGEREKRHPVAWWVPRYEGIRAARRGKAKRDEAKRSAFGARPRARAHGEPLRKRDSSRETSPGRRVSAYAHFTRPGVDSFCRRRLTLKIGRVLTRHRDNIAFPRRFPRESPRLSASGLSRFPSEFVIFKLAFSPFLANGARVDEVKEVVSRIDGRISRDQF